MASTNAQPEQPASPPSLQQALKTVEETLGPDSPAARSIRQQIAASKTGATQPGDIDPLTGRTFYEIPRVDGKGSFLVN